MSAMSLDAVVVLGCRVERGGALSGAAERRVARAARAYHEGAAPLLITSGGKCWYGISEARAFRTRLVELGVPEEQVLLELESHNTRQNARCSSLLAQKRGLSQLGIVTCDWHMPRALADFRYFGVEAMALPAQAPAARRQRAAEHVRRLLDRVVLRLADGAKRVPLFLLFSFVLVALATACQREPVTRVPLVSKRTPATSRKTWPGFVHTVIHLPLPGRPQLMSGPDASGPSSRPAEASAKETEPEQS